MSIENDIKQSRFTDEYHKLAVNLMFTASWLGDKHQQLIKPYGITMPQFNILRILRGQKGAPLSVNELIARMIDKSSNASRLVDKLEEKGYVLRKVCPEDRRQVEVSITEEGLTFIGSLDAPMQNMRTYLENLSIEEAEMLNQLLDKMRISNTLNQ